LSIVRPHQGKSLCPASAATAVPPQGFFSETIFRSSLLHSHRFITRVPSFNVLQVGFSFMPCLVSHRWSASLWFDPQRTHTNRLLPRDSWRVPHLAGAIC